MKNKDLKELIERWDKRLVELELNHSHDLSPIEVAELDKDFHQEYIIRKALIDDIRQTVMILKSK